MDLTRPYGVTIGDNVTFLRDAVVLTHGFDWCVLKKKYGEVLVSIGPVKIGNNVCICQGVTILKGVTIGENVIVGANSTVVSDCEANSVYVGTPAKKICSIEEYVQKRRAAQKEEAYQQFKAYWNKYHKNPEISLFNEFFYLFHDRKLELLDVFKKTIRTSRKL